MTEKILGIDLGSDQLKLVQVTRRLRAVQVSGYVNAGIPADADAAEVARRLQALISEHRLESDRYILAVGTHRAFLRSLSFPFSTERKIAQVIKFELEPVLPLPLDEVMVDFFKTERLKDGTQNVLAAALPKSYLLPLLAELKELGIEPELVDLDASTLSIIGRELREQLPERFIILDIGRQKTNLLYCCHGKIRYLRSLTFGLGHVAEAVSQVKGLSVEEALELLFSLELAGPEERSEDGLIREAVVKEIEILANDIELTLLGARKREREEDEPELVLLSGGGSLVRGLAVVLEQALSCPVKCLADTANGSLLGQLREQTKGAEQFTVAAGLTQRAMNRIEGFNFQAEELRSQSPLIKWRRQLIYGLVAAALVFVSWLASVGVDIYIKNQRYTQLNKGLETVFSRALPDFKGSVRHAQYASVLKSKIDELNQSAALFGAGAGAHSASNALRDLSQAIPKDLDVNMQLLTMDGQRVRLSGRADGFNTVDAIKNRLEASDNFAKVTISGAKSTADGKGVQFTLELLRQGGKGEGR